MGKLMLAAVFFAAVLGARLAAADEGLPERTQGKAKKASPVFTAAPAADDANLLVEVSAKQGEHAGAARFVVGSGSQANHILGGDKPYPVKHSQGTGVEFKKWGFIFNVLPTVSPKDKDEVYVQMQIELSGPEAGVTIPSGDIPAIGTWQYQSSFKVRKGRKTVVFESPARVELTVSDAQPAP
ncbi:MAG: hypothetical protein HY924_03375 [Elusimicrobia bacterium]|nr:hypothetical protein [Elusimicrobiota bacterium]